MDDVAEILSGHYGIRQHGKSAPMSASKPSNTATSSTGNGRIPSSGLPPASLEDKIMHSSSKNDRLLESLGLRLTEKKGLGFEELVNAGGAPVDPFLVFDADSSSLHQFSGKTNIISPAYVDERDFFDTSGCIGSPSSSFPSERVGNIGKIRTPFTDQNHSNVQNPLMGVFLNSNSGSRAPNPPPILDNFEFFRMYDTAEEEKSKGYNGIDEFFSGIGLGGSSPSMQMEASPENNFYTPVKVHGALGRGIQRCPPASNANINEKSSMKNMMSDQLFGIGTFQTHSKIEDVEGDNEYRSRARYEREKEKSARVAKALAEKNKYDLELQSERNEREMIAEDLDMEVKEWAAGREGNLRALLSTLQDVLWPECGWQPVSLSNLMTSTSVRKVYGKAALCVHPDKVQQKGSTIRQKYVAEKVFYLLTEALNKLNSEELT